MIRIFAGMCEPPAAQLDLERGIQKRGCMCEPPAAQLDLERGIKKRDCRNKMQQKDTSNGKEAHVSMFAFTGACTYVNMFMCCVCMRVCM